MDETPERKPSVPEEAVWAPDMGRWELVAKNAQGERNGEQLLFRTDGTLYMRSHFRAGVQEGPFLLYHPNGQVAREGTFVAGHREGIVSAFGSDGVTPERLRSCCVPPGAWEMRSSYEGGRLQRELFYNRDGKLLMSDGRVHPDQPASVPAGAVFEEHSNRWVVGRRDPDSGQPRGLWRWWTQAGILHEESEYPEDKPSDDSDGKKQCTRIFDNDGLREDVRFTPGGLREGAYYRRFTPAHVSPYADARIRQERGTFERGNRVGTWTWFDAAGAVVRTIDWGRAIEDAARSGIDDAFDDRARAADEWDGIARRLFDARRVREALLATARAVAVRRDTSALSTQLTAFTLPLSSEETARQAKIVADLQGDDVGAIAEALIAGADPAAVFRLLASVTKGTAFAARDFVEVSLLLAPGRPMTHMTRALIRVELGDDAGALSDAACVADESPDTATFLRDYVRVLFPDFSFSPAKESPTTANENMPDEPGQPLEALRHMVQVYATRLLQLRAAVTERLAHATGAASSVPSAASAPSWLPPDLSSLLPNGPVTLRNETAQILDETDTGVETTDVKVDETLAATAWSIPTLMRQARIDWHALCWLCWSAGLDRVALPDGLSPPPSFAAAATMAFTRCWRAQDAVTTHGLRSMTAGVPGFIWEGIDIDGISPPFTQMVLDEYQDMRALFLWLMSPENLSPFQSDLRELSQAAA